MQRRSVMATSAASEGIGQPSTLISFIHQVAEESKLHPAVPHDPVSSAMCEIGTITRRIFRQLVKVLSAGEVDESPSWVGQHEDDEDANEVLGTAPPKRAGTASPRMDQEPSGNDTRCQASPGDILFSKRNSGTSPGRRRTR